MRKLRMNDFKKLRGVYARGYDKYLLRYIDRFCAALHSHPQDIFWVENLPNLPAKRTYEPFYEIIKERNVSMRSLLGKTRRNILYHTMYKVPKFTDYDIYSFAYLLDVNPLDLIREVK